MSSTIICKIRLPSGNLAVYEVQPQHISDWECIRRYGTHLYSKFGNEWFYARGGHFRPLKDAKVTDSLAELPIHLDTLPGASWGVQLLTDSGLWRFVGPAGGAPYRYESPEMANRRKAMIYTSQPGQTRVIRFGLPMDENPLRHQFFTEEGTPFRCPHCGSEDISSVTVDSIDVGVGGGGISCEEEYTCKNCGETVGYWAYGGFDPGFPEMVPAE